MKEKGFLLSIIYNTKQLSPERIILAKNRKKALRVIEELEEGYSVGGKEVFFSGAGCSCKCELREIPLIQA